MCCLRMMLEASGQPRLAQVPRVTRLDRRSRLATVGTTAPTVVFTPFAQLILSEAFAGLARLFHLRAMLKHEAKRE